MKRMKVRIQRMTIADQQIGVPDEFMVSRVFFELVLSGQTLGVFYADIKQAVGSNFEDYVIEVGPPVGYAGAFGHAAFRAGVEKYYRETIGPEGRFIKFVGPVSQCTIVDCGVSRPMDFEFDVDA